MSNFSPWAHPSQASSNSLVCFHNQKPGYRANTALAQFSGIKSIELKLGGATYCNE